MTLLGCILSDCHTASWLYKFSVLLAICIFTKILLTLGISFTVNLKVLVLLSLLK
nr:MAG TPA: hypothetical protein [Caudoviricetes sp.]